MPPALSLRSIMIMNDSDHPATSGPEADPDGADALVDARGLRCPEPLMLVRHRMRELAPGQTLRVLATDPTTTRDLDQFCKFLGHEMLEQAEQGDELHYLMRRGER